MPSVEDVQRELSKAKSMDDFFGKEGIFAKLFAQHSRVIFEGATEGKKGTTNLIPPLHTEDMHFLGAVDPYTLIRALRRGASAKTRAERSSN